VLSFIAVIILLVEETAADGLYAIADVTDCEIVPFMALVVQTEVRYRTDSKSICSTLEQSLTSMIAKQWTLIYSSFLHKQWQFAWQEWSKQWQTMGTKTRLTHWTTSARNIQVFLGVFDIFDIRVPMKKSQRIKSHKSNILFRSPLAFLLRKPTQYCTLPSPLPSGSASKRFVLIQALLIQIGLN
jgi:hypothetical protein